MRSRKKDDNDYLIEFSISKTFASGRTEKRIFEILKELGLPSGKVRNAICFMFVFLRFFKSER